MRYIQPKKSILVFLISHSFFSISAFSAGFQISEISAGLQGDATTGAAAANNDISAFKESKACWEK